MVIGNGYGQFGADWLSTIAQAAPQITSSVNALKPLWTSTSSRPPTVVPVAPPPPPPQQQGMLSGNMPLILGGVAVLVIGALIISRR